MNYVYTIEISNGSQILTDGIYAKQFPSAEYITISSNEFARLRDCDRAMQKIMSELGNEELDKGKKPILVIQTNPNLDEDNEFDTPIEGWDDTTVLKSFLVNAEAVKNDNKTLMYSISGTIKCVLPD
jgi:hypothetical protein